jgi:hypothetical protein
MSSFRDAQPPDSARELSRLEKEALAMLASGDDPRFAVLRQQLTVCEVVRREFTGVGFFTHLAVPPSAPRLPIGADKASIGGVNAEVPNMQRGIGFVLFITDGVLDTLEAFTYDEPWPDDLKDFDLRYFMGEHPQFS